MKLEWTEPEDPNEDIRYTHVIAETPMGRIVIEWKGWKERPSYDFMMPWGEHLFSPWYTLDEAKAKVQEVWGDMATKMAGGSHATEWLLLKNIDANIRHGDFKHARRLIANALSHLSAPEESPLKEPS